MVISLQNGTQRLKRKCKIRGTAATNAPSEPSSRTRPVP
jgi:hypothetical protein